MAYATIPLNPFPNNIKQEIKDYKIELTVASGTDTISTTIPGLNGQVKLTTIRTPDLDGGTADIKIYDQGSFLSWRSYAIPESKDRSFNSNYSICESTTFTILTSKSMVGDKNFTILIKFI